MIEKASIGQRWGQYQPTKSTLVWACVISIAATLIIGFTWGGWVTGAQARDANETAAEDARSALVADICVERFHAAPDAAAHQAELNDITSSYKRREFVQAGGWATMPGEETAGRDGADQCAEALRT